MSLTLPELCSRLAKLDEITLMEVLEVSSEDLVDAFISRIEADFETLEAEMNDENT